MAKHLSRVVVVTGGTSGIGADLIRKLKQSGDKVCNLARSCDPLTEDNYICDVTDAARVEEVMRAIGKKYGRIDLLINNAGFGVSGALELLPTQKMKANMDVNFFGTMNCIQSALPFMKAKSEIINISSACALFPLPFRGMYCASKAAVSMMSYCLRMELADSKIRVVNICPGDIKTGFTEHRVKEVETNARYGERVKRAQYAIDSREDKRMPVGRATRKILKIAAKRHPKPMYIIGAKYKLFFALQKIFPMRWLNGAIGKIFGGY